jgi:hypothetical protein
MTAEDEAEEADLTERELELVRVILQFAAHLPPDPVTESEVERARAVMVRAGVTPADVDEDTVARFLRAYDWLLHS